MTKRKRSCSNDAPEVSEGDLSCLLNQAGLIAVEATSDLLRCLEEVRKQRGAIHNALNELAPRVAAFERAQRAVNELRSALEPVLGFLHIDAEGPPSLLGEALLGTAAAQEERRRTFVRVWKMRDELIDFSSAATIEKLEHWHVAALRIFHSVRAACGGGSASKNGRLNSFVQLALQRIGFGIHDAGAIEVAITRLARKTAASS